MNKVYAIEVETQFGPRLVGPWYANKEAAKSWVGFVKAYYCGAKTRTRMFSMEQAKQIKANGGQLTCAEGALKR